MTTLVIAFVIINRYKKDTVCVGNKNDSNSGNIQVCKSVYPKMWLIKQSQLAEVVLTKKVMGLNIVIPYRYLN